MRILLVAGVLVLGLACSTSEARDEPRPLPTWAFEPDRDTFSPDALLDLRFLNERVAGERGFVTTRNGRFYVGDEEIRFWCVNSFVGREQPWTPRPLWPWDEPQLAHSARFLAKRGVNMVRLHSQISPDLERTPNAAYHDVNESERDWIWRAIAAYRREGIYTTWSPYWAVPMKFAPGWHVPGGHEQDAFGLLFFDEGLQAAYKAWLRAVLEPPNPHTGIPLARDPALAIFQIQNEDSLLFWTVNSIQGEQRRRLGVRFANWLHRKYGSPAAVAQSWENVRLEGDDSEAGHYDFYNIWEMTQDRTGGMQRRLADQLEFWTRAMHDFNTEIARFLREDLGCRFLINAGNWKTASDARLADAERFSYTANEVDAVNHYFGGIHQGPYNGWAIVNGDTFTRVSALRQPWRLPINVRQTEGRPMLVTESIWVPPNGYGAEGPFLIATYQSLTGIAGYYWFATGNDEWTPPASANGYMPSQGKWIFGSPDVLGGFPAAALLYRQGYVDRATPVVREVRPVNDLWERRPAEVPENSGFDPNRDQGDGTERVAGPLAFLLGPVVVRFVEQGERETTFDLPATSTDGVLIGKGGQIRLDPRKGQATIDAPKVQGVAAFFDGEVVRLSATTWQSENPYGAALAVTIDGRPLTESGKVLIQFTTEARPTGWEDRPMTLELDGGRRAEGREVVAFGRAPWQVTEARLRIGLRNARLSRVTALDANGLPIGPVEVRREGEWLRFDFPPRSLYAVAQE